MLHLGKDANEKVVKNTDLSRYRIVAFSTHGLLPGDLNGLTQPALALSAPEVAEIEGDGLLTMDEILPLKLDADWVVLSACNTAAGARWCGGGFGAWARVLLCGQPLAAGDQLVRPLCISARSRVGRVPPASGGRQPEPRRGVAAGDGGADRRAGYVAEGKTLYTYAHPLFWAPYSLIGDGGN